MAANEEVVFSEELVSKYEKDHNEEGFWDKIKKVGTKIGVAPIYLVFLLYHSLMSKNIPLTAKAPIAGALGYFISLIDAIPDVTPFLGYCDDVSIVVGALGFIAAKITPEIRDNAKKSTRKIFSDITDEEFSLIDDMYEKSGDAVNAANIMKRMKKDIRKKNKEEKAI